MRILLVSTFEPGAYGHVIRHTLDKMGHVVRKFDHIQTSMKDYSKVGELDQKFELACEAYEPELIFIVKGRGLTPSIIKKQTAKKVLWWTDSIKRYADFQEYVDSVDKAYCLEEGQNFPWMPTGIDEYFHKPYHVDNPLSKSDVIFIGTGHYFRTNEILRIFTGLTDYNLAIWGNAWPKNPYQRGKAIYQLDTMAVYTEAKIILNKHYIPGITPNMRAFEAPASGTMVLSDTGKGLEECFKEGKEFVAYKDERDARYLIRKYLEDEDERLKIAKAGFDRVRKDHQLSDRMVKMLI